MPLAEDPLGDHEFPSDDDLSADGEEPAELACPSCGADVMEDAQKCPQCGDWITPVDPAGAGWRRWLLIAAVLLMLLTMLLWMF